MQSHNIAVLFTPNRSRLHHLRKVHSLRGADQYIGICVGLPCANEDRFFDAFRSFPRNVGFEEVLSWVKVKMVTAVVNLTEATVPLHAVLAAGLGVPGPSISSAEVCRNKCVMREVLGQLEIRCPRNTVMDLHELALPVGWSYPIVVKPVRGFGSAFVAQCENDSDLKSAGERIRINHGKHSALQHPAGEGSGVLGQSEKVLVEECLDGQLLYKTTMPYELGECSVESVSIGGDVAILAIHDSPVLCVHGAFQKFMNSTPSRLPDDIQNQAIAAVSRLHMMLGDGMPALHTEFRITTTGLQLLEFGGRIGGASIYRSVLLSTGNDMIDILVATATQRTAPPLSSRAQPTMVQYLHANKPGKVTGWAGVSRIFALPDYVDCQLYDDVGDEIPHAFESTRASGYVIVQGADFGGLEEQLLECIRHVRIETR